MNPTKNIARIVGVLFIIGTVAGSLSVLLANPLLESSNYISEFAANSNRVITASILVFIMAFALAMVPVVLYPIFKKYNEAVAMGAVLFRGALEAVAYIIVALSWILIMVLGQHAGAASTDGTTVQSLGAVLHGLSDWGAHVVSIVFSIGALMIYWLFYVSKLIPRWLAVWGVIGGALYLISPFLTMYGFEFGVLMAPLAVQEMVLALWLIIRGFNTTPKRA